MSTFTASPAALASLANDLRVDAIAVLACLISRKPAFRRSEYERWCQPPAWDPMERIGQDYRVGRPGAEGARVWADVVSELVDRKLATRNKAGAVAVTDLGKAVIKTRRPY